VLTIPFHIPYISGKETEYIANVITKKSFSGNGTYHHKSIELLKKLTQAHSIYLTTSCTSALEIAALAIGITHGDEVILPSFTFVSTANAFALRGAKLRFADIEKHSLNISLDEIKRLVTPKTKAIVVVHYNGFSDNIAEIKQFAKNQNIYLIEDAAHAINGFYNSQHLGTFGDIGCISFHETKNIHCGEGGCILVNNSKLREKVEQIIEKGTNRTEFLKGESPYYEWKTLGLSADMDEVRAAFLTAQLENVKSVTELRFKHLLHNLSELKKEKSNLKISYLPSETYFEQSNAHILWALSDDREFTVNQLKKKGIITHSHYTPLHLSTFGKKYYETPLPVTESICNKIIRFPVHTIFQL
jgi:dTDP-4-amino-4,6-dideoxygalactose transaminase